MSKVLMISGSLPPIRCGVGYYAAHLCQELAKQGVDFEILSTAGVNQDTPAPLRTVPNWKIRSLPKIMRAVKQSDARIIHIQYPAVGYRRQLGINLLPYFLRLRHRDIKILITLHEYHQSRRIGKLRNLITIWPAHRVFVSNQPDKTALQRFGNKVSVVPIGANFETAARQPELFKKIMRSQQLDPAKPPLIFFGYAFPSKKLDVLLDAMGEPGLKDYQLLLIGSFGSQTAYQQKLKQAITKLNQDKPRVGETGFLEGPDASAILQEGKYFIMPNAAPLSAKSGTAIAAIQNNLIVISKGASQPAATAPYIHLRNCYLLDEVSPQSIAQAIIDLDNSPAKAKTIHKGAAKLKEYFSWSHIISEHLRTYREL